MLFISLFVTVTLQVFQHVITYSHCWWYCRKAVKVIVHVIVPVKVIVLVKVVNLVVASDYVYSLLFGLFKNYYTVCLFVQVSIVGFKSFRFFQLVVLNQQTLP